MAENESPIHLTTLSKWTVETLPLTGEVFDYTPYDEHKKNNDEIQCWLAYSNMEISLEKSYVNFVICRFSKR